MRAAVLAILCVLLVGCAGTKETRRAAREQRRCARYVAKHPTCFRADTVRDTVVVAIPREGFDSLLYVSVLDTVWVDSGRVRIQVVRIPTGGPCDTVQVPIYVKADCDSARAEVPVAIPCPPRPLCPAGGVADWWRTVALVLAGVLAVCLWLLARRR